MDIRFPEGKRFAFTIVDDTDVATVENVRPVYDTLYRLGIGATKTVWPVSCPEGSPHFYRSETLEDPKYLEFVRELKARGFEITWHSATMESSPRERVLYALERFEELLGHAPRIHVNHAMNRENLYWGEDRFDLAPVRMVAARISGLPHGFFGGHLSGSEYWWGDRCRETMMYARNLTFDRVNLRTINPTLPYRDPRRPLVPFWFSASDAEDVDEFNHLLRRENQERLEREGGICIVATHFGKGFGIGGRLHPVTERLLIELAGRPGWFPTLGALLDTLRAQGAGRPIPRWEWSRMQLQWVIDLARRKLRARRPRTRRRGGHTDGR